MPGSAPSKTPFEHPVVGVHRRLDRQLEQLHPEVGGQRPRVGLRALGGEGGGHDDAGHALGAERVDGDQRHERRVDPAREAEDDALEAVLLDVVAHPERERRVDLRYGREQRREVAADPLHRWALGALELAELAYLRQRPAHGRAQPRVAQARGHRRLQVDVGEHEPLGELRPAREHRALVVDHQRVAVEHELVLAADEVAEGDRAEVVARALDDHALALEALARVVGRGREVDDQRRAGQRLVRFRGPGDQMSSQMVRPMRASPKSITAPPSPAWK